ncbi:MAG: hypothetical protein KDA80_07500, partial [Planctomycetaceae bacterium]|nr:hypothetical protein [Planctomycetaceae bacterium]
MTEIGNDSLAQRPPGRADVWLALAIIVPTLFAYSPVFHAGFIWDDDDHIYENDNLDSRQGLVNIWLSPLSSPQYYPLTHTVFWFEHQLWGDHPAGYHIVSVLFHVAGALLLWRNLRLLNVPGAWMAAAIFALHPVHSESVAWISETKNTLSGALFLGSALSFLKFNLG